MTYEEQAINALPELYRQKMARYCLDGWMFRRYAFAVVSFWMADKYPFGSHTSNTLLTLLDLMDGQLQLPNTATEHEQSVSLQDYTCEE